MSGVLLFLMIFLTSCMKNDTVASDGNTDKILVEERNVNGIFAHITTNDSVHHIVNHPSFKGFGQFILPLDHGTYDGNMQLSRVGSLLPYHSHVEPEAVVNTINYMIDQVAEGKTIFYNFYTERQKQENPAKENYGPFLL